MGISHILTSNLLTIKSSSLLKILSDLGLEFCHGFVFKKCLYGLKNG